VYLAHHLDGLTRRERDTLEGAVKMLEAVLRDWQAEE
jgi:hypothetical protein